MTELNDAELDSVSGGIDGYHFCWDGPAGNGLYPSYIGCAGPTNAEVYKAFFDGFHRGGGTP